MSETSETPLATQTAAPPPPPPRRASAGIAMGDWREDFLARLEEQRRHLLALRDDIDRMIAERLQWRHRRRRADLPDV